MMMLNDLLRRIPMLAVAPLIVWLLGMTVYTASWKAENDYKLARVLEATATIDRQTERIAVMEQKLLYLTDYIRELKDSLKEKTK